MFRPQVGAAMALALAFQLAPDAARADEIHRAWVVRLEAGEIYIDVGKASGLAPGAPVRFRRPITLKHPVTLEEIVDELPLGESTIASVGETLSMIIPTPGQVEAVQVGDVAETYIVKDVPKPVKPARPRPTPAPLPDEQLPAVDAATAEVLAVWGATLGRPIAEREAAWETYLAAHAGSPYEAALREDLARMRALKERIAAWQTEATSTEPQVDGLAHLARTRVPYHEPIDVVFAATDLGGIRAAWLHFRKRGSETFRKAELVVDGDAYLRGQIAADVVEDPGVEYFVEVATTEGVVGSAVGAPDAPIAVRVDAQRTNEIFREKKKRSRISIHTTYLDYATFDKRTGDHTDTFFLVEADFLYRLYTRLYGIRVGFGSLNGKGGAIDWGQASPPSAGFNYGYTEVELRGRWNVALMGRLVAGLGDDGLGFGVQGSVRLGPEQGTNLTFGASTLEDIGFLSELHLQWAVFPRFPLGFGVALTNQPLGADGDLGVRFSADLGIRALSWFQPTLRFSYQGRTVEHSGVGGGLGLVFDW